MDIDGRIALVWPDRARHVIWMRFGALEQLAASPASVLFDGDASDGILGETARANIDAAAARGNAALVVLHVRTSGLSTVLPVRIDASGHFVVVH